MKRFAVLIENIEEKENTLMAIEEMLMEDPRIVSMESRFWGNGPRACAELTWEFDGDPLLVCMEILLRYDVPVRML
jgi:hypothetical protein